MFLGYLGLYETQSGQLALNGLRQFMMFSSMVFACNVVHEILAQNYPVLMQLPSLILSTFSEEVWNL